MKYPKLLQSTMGGLGGFRHHINHTSLLCLPIIFSSNHKTLCHHIIIKNQNLKNILPLSCASFPLWRSLRLSLQRKSSSSGSQDFWKIFEAVVGLRMVGSSRSANSRRRQQAKIRGATGGFYCCLCSHPPLLL